MPSTRSVVRDTYLGVGIPGLPRVRPVVPVAPPERESAGPARRAPPVATRQSAAVRVRVRDMPPCERHV